MTRDWKPGDVAMVTMGHGPQLAIFTGEFWAWSDGTGHYSGVSHCHRDAPARPAVVIDPEDREQIHRLISDYYERVDAHDGSFSNQQGADWMQAALRSLITPPRPEQPEGIGAVIEDAEARIWVRAADADWWRCAVDPAAYDDVGEFANYADITAVRVLSEGVQP